MKQRGSSPNRMGAPDRHNGQRDASLRRLSVCVLRLTLTLYVIETCNIWALAATEQQQQYIKTCLC